MLSRLSSALPRAAGALSARSLAAAASAATKLPAQPTVAIVGATGAVGQELMDLLAERAFPSASIKLLASARSAGKTLKCGGEDLLVEELTANSFEGVDIAFFSAGGSQSTDFAPAAVNAGCTVIDNSSAYRMDPNCPLVVPEVNADALDGHNGIIANPNCSTIIMNVAVWPLYQANKVKRVVVSTYQAASGAGAAAMAELEQQARDWVEGRPLTQDIFGRQYVWSLFSHNSDVDTESGYNEEEVKMIKETSKIFGCDDIRVTATCIRVPVLRAHCESINITFENPMDEAEARAILSTAPGVSIIDDRANNVFPDPLMASFKDDVYVGRIRNDPSQDGNGIELFVAGDQIRKGAALNAVQIAEELLRRQS